MSTGGSVEADKTGDTEDHQGELLSGAQCDRGRLEMEGSHGAARVARSLDDGKLLLSFSDGDKTDKCLPNNGCDLESWRSSQKI